MSCIHVRTKQPTTYLRVFGDVRIDGHPRRQEEAQQRGVAHCRGAARQRHEVVPVVGKGEGRCGDMAPLAARQRLRCGKRTLEIIFSESNGNLKSAR